VWRVVGVLGVPVSTGSDPVGGGLIPAFRAVISRLEELLCERGVEVDHVTLLRWVVRFTPSLIDAADPYRCAVTGRWFVAETYVKVSGVWDYVYRSIDDLGHVIDVYVSKRRDTVAARQFFTTVTNADRMVLVRWSKRPTAPRSIAQRARIMLLAADGLSKRRRGQGRLQSGVQHTASSPTASSAACGTTTNEPTPLPPSLVQPPETHQS
jgi:hypothetical protein